MSRSWAILVVAASAVGFGGAVVAGRAADPVTHAASAPRSAPAVALGDRSIAIRDAGPGGATLPALRKPKPKKPVVRRGPAIVAGPTIVDPPVTVGGTSTVGGSSSGATSPGGTTAGGGGTTATGGGGGGN